MRFRKAKPYSLRRGRVCISWWLVALVALLALQTLVLVQFGHQKQGYHADEMYTYGLANSSKQPFLTDEPEFTNQWHIGNYFREYLTTQPEEQFHYGHTYINQKLDVHPPFYYYVFHTVSSFVPNVFSKWVGLIPNILFFLISNVVLYFLGRELFRSRMLALLPCVFWGFSAGMTSSVLYFRMYACVTVFTMLLTLLDWKLVQAKTLSWRYMLALGLTVFLGFMTHYYFVIYLLYLGLPLAAYLIYRRRGSDLLKCLVGTVGGGLLGILYFPECLRHIFVGYRGAETWERIAHSTNWQTRIHNYLSIINRELLGGKGRWVLLAMLCAAAVGVVLYSLPMARDKLPAVLVTRCTPKFLHDVRFFLVGQTGLACLLYLVTIARISPYDVDRYVFPILPQLMLLLAFVGWLLLRALHCPRAVCAVVLAVLSLSTSSLCLGEKYVAYRYPQPVNTEQVAAANGDSTCFAVYDKKYYAYVYFLFPDFMHYPQTYVMDTDHMGTLSAQVAQKVPTGKPVMLYLRTQRVDVLQRLEQDTGRSRAQKLFAFHGFTAYRLS